MSGPGRSVTDRDRRREARRQQLRQQQTQRQQVRARAIRRQRARRVALVLGILIVVIVLALLVAHFAFGLPHASSVPGAGWRLAAVPAGAARDAT